jgi:predicted aldo/keto reductase-like oxidoreductase
VEWAFRHILDYAGVSTVLSGVTTLEQLKEDIAIFSKEDTKPGCLSPQEKAIIQKVKAAYEGVVTVPCTACEYCMPCPSGVNIPGVFKDYNDGMMFENFAQPSRSYFFKRKNGSDASHCVECGACLDKCPQHIAIIDDLKTAHAPLKDWVE